MRYDIEQAQKKKRLCDDLLRLSPVPQRIWDLGPPLFRPYFLPERCSQCWAVAFSVHILSPFFVHFTPNLIPERFSEESRESMANWIGTCDVTSIAWN